MTTDLTFREVIEQSRTRMLRWHEIPAYGVGVLSTASLQDVANAPELEMLGPDVRAMAREILRLRAEKHRWSILEWSAAMAGESGEACNAAKKLRRIELGHASINEQERSFSDAEAARKHVAKEVADTILYGMLVCSVAGEDLVAALIEVFNAKSEEYGFPERIGV